MALVKQGYRDALRGTASVSVPLNSSGNIAQAGDSINGYKTINFTAVDAANNLEQNQYIAELFLDFVGGSINRTDQKVKVVWNV